MWWSWWITSGLRRLPSVAELRFAAESSNVLDKIRSHSSLKDSRVIDIQLSTVRVSEDKCQLSWTVTVKESLVSWSVCKKLPHSFLGFSWEKFQKNGKALPKSRGFLQWMEVVLHGGYLHLKNKLEKSQNKCNRKWEGTKTWRRAMGTRS